MVYSETRLWDREYIQIVKKTFILNYNVRIQICKEEPVFGENAIKLSTKRE